MGRRGPAPKPAGLKLVEGRGHGRDSGGRKVPAIPGFARDAPEPPDWLPVEARAEWDRIVPELQRVQLLKPGDRALLAAYCLTWARLVQAQHELDAAGSVLGQNSQGRVRHPAVQVIEGATRELRQLAAEFGLSPSSEQRVAQPEGDNDATQNPFAAGAAD